MVRERDRRVAKSARNWFETLLNAHPNYDRVDLGSYDLRARKLGGEVISGKIAEILQSRLPRPDYFNRAASPRVLDIAAGTGITSLHLWDLGYAVTATDISQNALDFLQRRNRNIPAMKGDMNGRLPFEDGSFEAIVTSWANRFMVSQNVCNETYRLLKDNGVFIWPVDRWESFDWKLQTGFFQPTMPSILARRLRNTGFSVDVVKASRGERNPMHTYLVATKPARSR